jgi:hypothetical protein
MSPMWGSKLVVYDVIIQFPEMEHLFWFILYFQCKWNGLCGG